MESDLSKEGHNFSHIIDTKHSILQNWQEWFRIVAEKVKQGISGLNL